MAGTASKAPSPLATLLAKYRVWILISLTLLLVVIVRLRTLSTPLERDEGEYAYAGQLILQGVPPYNLVYNMKLPGTYAAYALIMAVFGQTPSGIHFGLMLVNIAAILMVFFLGQRLLDSTAGIAAAVAYALMSMSSSVLGLQAHATHFVMLAALGGALLLLRGSESGRWPALLGSGLFFGLAFLMKQHGFLFGIFGMLYLTWVRIRVKVFKPQVLLRDLGFLILGMALPYLVMCGVLWMAGVFHEFTFWSISYAYKYISLVPFRNGPLLFRGSMYSVAGPNIYYWILALFGAASIWWEHRMKEKHRLFLAILLVCSCLSICIGLYFRRHYFVQVLPVFALLAGATVSRGLYLLKHDRTIELLLAVPILGLFIVGLGSELITNGEVWFALSPARVSERIYDMSLFPETEKVGRYLRENSDEKATIAVIGSEPEIYFYAKRHSATGFIYMYPLMELHSYAGKMQSDMIREIEAARPDFIVFVNVYDSWLWQEDSNPQVLSWWRGYCDAGYELVRSANINGSRSLGMAGDPQRANLLVLKRKAPSVKATASNNSF